MDTATNSPAAPISTPAKGFRSKNQESSKYSENINPNKHSTPSSKPLSNSCSSSSSPSPVVKKSCSKSQKKPQATAAAISNNNTNHHANEGVLNSVNSVSSVQKNKIRQRKFVVAKKNKNKKCGDGDGDGDRESNSTAAICKCKESNKNNKCLCVAYQNLRKSQEEFFKNKETQEQDQEDGTAEIDRVIIEEEQQQQQEEEARGENCGGLGNAVDLAVKRRRERLMEEARKSVPEAGPGKVMHLVKAFEKLLTVSTTEKKDQDQDQDQDQLAVAAAAAATEKEPQEKEENKVKKKVMRWALPGLPFPNDATERTQEEVSGSSSFCPPQVILTSENLGLDPKALVSSSWDSSRGSVSNRTSNGGRRSRRNSLESTSTFGGSRWKKKQQLKVTSQKPFKLRTEERGKVKEEEFVKKIHELMTEEEKQRIPIAQGLPWTTDEPECLVKPPVKEITRPIDLQLHSDVRAMDRAEFDNQVAEKLSFIEQYKLEKERQQKMAEEEEIKRLRKELVPKAQPMPYFDRPFIPRRSVKNPTIPKEPKFHIPHHKKIKCSLSSWSDLSP
ncbi:hypothetical protein PIB30_026900 [Stylosanthes scabra]|uniref:TPX2 C-terminal domain-containing protein n=1 Tax=Stylosanthes scabra TaxID=79078 RepID=A0ABU6WAM7_9FABA|nr:hypothetical protein [Stylosanthes scabra]